MPGIPVILIKCILYILDYRSYLVLLALVFPILPITAEVWITTFSLFPRGYFDFIDCLLYLVSEDKIFEDDCGDVTIWFRYTVRIKNIYLCPSGEGREGIIYV